MEEAIKAADERTLYITPFPYDSSLDELTKFFETQAPVNSVRLRRFLSSKDFRGSIFVEFDTVESATKVAEADLEFAGAPLRMMPKTAFKEEVIELRHAKAEAAGKQVGDAWAGWDEVGVGWVSLVGSGCREQAALVIPGCHWRELQ